MATIGIQLGGLLIAAALAWAGIQGLRGVPDTTGKTTGKGTAIACLVIAALLGIGALVAPYLMWGR
jgi:hypothetical protein